MSVVHEKPVAPAPDPPGGGSRWRERLGRVSAAEWLGWGGVALGLLAFYLALPPVLTRTVMPSALLALLGLTLGALAVRAGARRVGWGAVVASLAGFAGAVAATASGAGNLERVVVWSALAAAMLRYATPITFAALGGVTSERSGVVNLGLEGMMLCGAFFGAWGADVTGSWVGGLVIGMASGAVLALVHAVFAVTLRADQIVSGTAVNLLAPGVTRLLFVDRYGEQGTPDDPPPLPDVSLPNRRVPLLRQPPAHPHPTV